MYFTDNPIADAERYMAEQEAELRVLPECAECGEKIQDEYCYEFNGEYICWNCLKEYHEVRTEDLIG